jgi:hypothetical protein
MQIFPDMPGAKATATSFSITYNIIQAPVSDDPSSEYNAVRAALLAFVPVSNAPPGAVYAWPRRALELTEAGWGAWKATVTWASLSYQYALKIGGAQQQVRCDKTLTQLYHDPAVTPPAYNPGDAGRPIGWDGRSVHGCSIYVPTRTWTESVEIPISQYSFDYEDQVAAVENAPVNSLPFRGYNPGEVRFAGMNAQLSTQNPDFVTAAYEFEQTDNRSVALGNAITIDGITGIEKDGWDYLDVHYETVVDTAAQLAVPRAQYVLIHRVYDRTDFTPLNIGTGEALPVWQG